MLSAGLMTLAILSCVVVPKASRAEPQTDNGSAFQACGVLHREDPNVSVAECARFLEASAWPRKAGWVPPFCLALAYYEPELFYSVYTSATDCVVHNGED